MNAHGNASEARRAARECRRLAISLLVLAAVASWAILIVR